MSTYRTDGGGYPNSPEGRSRLRFDRVSLALGRRLPERQTWQLLDQVRRIDPAHLNAQDAEMLPMMREKLLENLKQTA